MQRALGSLTARCFDAAVRPRLTRFVFDEVLAMPQSEFLVGATQAAGVVCDAISLGVTGNDQQLLQLRDEGLLQPSLFSAMSEKLVDRRSRLFPEGQPWLPDRLESDVQLTGPAWLQHTRLIVGAQRATFDLTEKARLDLGAHLVVCGDRSGWHPPPLELGAVHRLGCTVQLTVLFDRHAPLAAAGGAPEGVFPHLPQNATPQSFTFEAAVAGRSDTDAASDAASEELSFRVVDVNGLARGGIAFWSGADAVDPVRLLFPDREQENL